MAHDGKDICLCARGHFVTINVTSDPTEEEVQNINLRRRFFPRLHLRSLGPTAEINLGTSFVSVGSTMMCIACPEREFKRSKDVRSFNPKAAELKFDYSLPKMKQARLFPAVIAMRGVVYVFGGIWTDEDIFAECLDTNQPKHTQQWVALEPPPFHLTDDLPCAVPFGDGILVFGRDIAQDYLLYNVNEDSWRVRRFIDGDRDTLLPFILDPMVFVEHNSTMYWLFGQQLTAFDLNTKEFTFGDMCNSVLSDEMLVYDLRDWSAYGKILMHLKENVFCVFTADKLGTPYQVLECTKFRVTKRPGFLQIEAIGYQAYGCDGISTLFDGVPMCMSIGGSMEPATKKHKPEEDKDMVHYALFFYSLIINYK